MRNFRNYAVWENSIEFCKLIYKMTDILPKTEQYGLTSQIQRASVSISSNIAEGCSRKSDKDFARFIEIALGSAYEVENLLELSYGLQYIAKETKIQLIDKLTIIAKQLNSLISKLRKQQLATGN